MTTPRRTCLPSSQSERSMGRRPKAALDFLASLRGIVHPVPQDAYDSLRAIALSRIESRDPDDWPILATALTLDCPIWTEDQDFFGAGVPTWTTDRVELYLDSEDPSGPPVRK